MHSDQLVLDVRDATADDARATAAIQVAGWQFAYRGILPDQLLDSLRPENREARHREQIARGDTIQLVALDAGGAAVGWAAAGAAAEAAEREGGFGGEVLALYVSPHVVGRGCGFALMRAAVDRMADRGWPHVCVRVLRDNRRGVAFYTRLGGQFLRDSSVEVGGARYPEVVYGYRNARELLRERR